MTDDLDALWDFSDPQASEARFRNAAAAGGTTGLLASTQLARALGLQERFEEAHAVLDAADAATGDARGAAAPQLRARSALERGRLWRSAGDTAAARPFFEVAATVAR